MSQFQNLCQELKNKHPRSGHTDVFIKKAEKIIFGQVDFLPRTDFYVQTGPQWGISFVSKLIDLNLLKVMKNKNKKQFIANINCHSLSIIKSEEIIKFK